MNQNRSETIMDTAYAASAETPTQEIASKTSRWDKETDVLVVGSGYAGLSASIEAYDAGASVMIMEKMPASGGNSIISGGVYNCVDPRRQNPLGIKDSIEWHFQQTIAGGDYRADPLKVRYLVEHALDGWQWLESMGVEMAGPIFQVYGALWPRSHVGQYKGLPAGKALTTALLDQIKIRHIPILLKHRVTKIFRLMPHASEGRVLGVEVESESRKLTFKAKRGLVLASGGFCADVETRMRHDPRFDAQFGTTNHSGATAETLHMAQDIGADGVGIDFIQSIGPTGPDVRYVTSPAGHAPLFDNPMILIGGLSVAYCIYTDLRGQRIVAADARRDHITEATMRTAEKVCVSITDDVSRERRGTSLETLEKLMRQHPKEIFKAETIRALAVQIGMPDPSILESTVARYNSFVDTKNDPEFGQASHNLDWKCEKPPFWAATGSPALHHMCGGLRTKATTAQVLDRWNNIIPAIYAAGEIVGAVHGTNRLGGNAIADCIVFGRLAGQMAAAEEPWS